MFSLPDAAFALLSVVGVSETKLFFLFHFFSSLYEETTRAEGL